MAVSKAQRVQSANYRPEIDGLRFVAVMPVVLFHAGISGFSGGFVGVDVFFVISGYLITGIILRELDNGTFSIMRFYERRIRRIFPALFALIAFVCVVAPASLLPSELRSLPYEVIGALTFVANIVFWRQASYFATAAHEKPLLHMWSLGVEEQFYIFAPLILWLLVRRARNGVLPVILAAMVLSFALCVYFTPGSPNPSFYLLPFRAWELLAGSVLATVSTRSCKPLFKEGFAVVGLLALLVAIFAFDEQTVFPGYAAALPVSGAALIIGFAEGTLVGRLLSRRPLVFIGLVSYSLYLWHWPLIVFFRDWGLLDTLSSRVAVVFLSLACAWVSWKYVETPFRRSGNWPRPRLFRFAGIGTGLLATAAVGLYLTNGWPGRFTPEDVAFDVARNDISPERKRCHINDGNPSFDSLCRLGAEAAVEPDTLLWADSHGVEMAAALAEAGLPVIQATYSGCPPAVGLVIETRPLCRLHNDRVLMAVEASEQIKVVVLMAYYTLHSSPEFWEAMRGSVARLRLAGKKVVVLGPLPGFGRDVPSYLASGHRGSMATRPVPPEFDRYLSDVTVVSVIERLCPDGECPLVVNGKPLLFDESHLSMTSARSIAADMVRSIRGAL